MPGSAFQVRRVRWPETKVVQKIELDIWDGKRKWRLILEIKNICDLDFYKDVCDCLFVESQASSNANEVGFPKSVLC